jgi:hypothetical protein
MITIRRWKEHLKKYIVIRLDTLCQNRDQNKEHYKGINTIGSQVSGCALTGSDLPRAQLMDAITLRESAS